MAIVALDNSTEKTYELSRDPDKGTEAATRFLLGAVPSRVLANIRDKATHFVVDQKGEEVSTQVDQNKTNIEIVSVGLRGWENMKNSDGGDIAFSTKKRNIAGRSLEVADDSVIDALALDDINELANEIISMNALEPRQRKKSGK